MKKLAIAMAICLTAVIGGIAYASIPDSSGVIHACYKTGALNKGQLKVIDSPTQSCAAGEAPLNWNQSGPAGGLSGVQVVTEVYDTTSINQGFTAELDVDCPSGKIATGGGYERRTDPPEDMDNSGYMTWRSYPKVSGGLPTGWAVFMQSVDVDTVISSSTTIYAICANSA